VTCPAGVTCPVARSGRVTFGAACHGCPLRDWCTTSADGRSLKLTEYDAALRAACAAWSSDPGLRQDYAQHRPHVERVIAQAATWLGASSSSATAGWPRTMPGSSAAPLRSTCGTWPARAHISERRGWSGVTSPGQDAVDDADGAFGHGLADVRLAFGRFAVVAVLRPGKPQPSAGLGVALGLACDGRFPSVPDAHEPGLGQGVKHVPDGARFQSLEPRVGRVGLEPTTGGL
jgi:Transposase DDE domain